LPFGRAAGEFDDGLAELLIVTYPRVATFFTDSGKSSAVMGRPVITDLKGAEHNWREELIDALAKQVKSDGSWVNDAKQWWGNHPVLATCYAVLALQEATKK